MNFLVTAGSTHAPVDRVRCVTNSHPGRAGTVVARTAWGRGHTVTLVTSRPDALLEHGINPRDPGERFSVLPYHTYDELTSILQNQLRVTAFDVVCHAASVGDYLSGGAFTPASGTFFNARTGQWEARTGAPTLAKQAADKINSAEPELWVRLLRAPKLADRIRHPWGFAGLLVKCETEAGLSEQQLVDAAEASRQQSAADVIVANTVEGEAHWAYLGPVGDRYERVTRRELPDRLVLALEDLYQKRT
ncbi:phosphopantothenoylcysteine decarboxylase [Gemmata sp. JC717]|uniref:Bifunctional phosphopantothenoylcysteine decarboxylase/phosphopantothenate synthase n=1 Tax=Gemmata algarum TaxID=2975278 RepID=A0ABU5ESQ3_9BACT|nr:phosphopantothenoylcysteine decarboxylase [Gemmata algarum]MDY3552183.1 phosphopantothenoylcysteine decarboxylase [Gemmata algarum]MDY3558279.1 bifunctional phosphopantothenoylcysteine decarboxylase/phosphopantothenate synthase [Gemmata algarum]